VEGGRTGAHFWLERVEGAPNLGNFHYIPILYFGGERIRQTQRDLLGLYGLILGSIQGRQRTARHWWPESSRP
jgi:hypothetical protein